MPTGPITLDRVASVPLALLGVVMLVRMHSGTSSEAFAVLNAVLGALAVVVAARMWCASCFESHLLAQLIAAAATVGQLLALAVGPPGGSAAGMTVDRLVLLVLGAGTLLLLGFAGVGRRPRRPEATGLRPYAR